MDIKAQEHLEEDEMNSGRDMAYTNGMEGGKPVHATAGRGGRAVKKEKAHSNAPADKGEKAASKRKRKATTTTSSGSEAAEGVSSEEQFIPSPTTSDSDEPLKARAHASGRGLKSGNKGGSTTPRAGRSGKGNQTRKKTAKKRKASSSSDDDRASSSSSSSGHSSTESEDSEATDEETVSVDEESSDDDGKRAGKSSKRGQPSKAKAAKQKRHSSECYVCGRYGTQSTAVSTGQRVVGNLVSNLMFHTNHLPYKACSSDA
jgi:hypothetical protein